MKAVILVAGTGSRLKPHTNDCPKALVPLFGRPMLDKQVDVLYGQGITDITLVAGYLAKQFSHYPVKIKLNQDYRHSNMLHSLMQARSLFCGDEDLIIAYGDIVYQANVLRQLIQAHGEFVVSADTHWHDLWSLRMEDPLADAESFIYDPSTLKLISLGQKITKIEDAQAQYIGLIMLKPSSFNSILSIYDNLGLEKTKNMYLTDFIQILINSEMDVRTSLHNRGWLEVDTTEDLNCYQRLYSGNCFDRLGFK